MYSRDRSQVQQVAESLPSLQDRTTLTSLASFIAWLNLGGVVGDGLAVAEDDGALGGRGWPYPG